MLFSSAQAQAVLSKSTFWQRLQTEVSSPNSAVGPRLDGNWTAIGRVLPVSPCPSELCHFLQVWMEEGSAWDKTATTEAAAMANVAPRLDPVGSRLGRDWPAIGGSPGKVILYNPHLILQDLGLVRICILNGNSPIQVLFKQRSCDWIHSL